MAQDPLELLNLDYDKLTEDEKKVYESWLTALSNQEVSVSMVRDKIVALRESVEKKLTEHTTTPGSWLSIASFLIPIVGLVRKWYADQELENLKARLRTYLLIEILLSSPERAKKMLERQIATMASNIPAEIKNEKAE